MENACSIIARVITDNAYREVRRSNRTESYCVASAALLETEQSNGKKARPLQPAPEPKSACSDDGLRPDEPCLTPTTGGRLPRAVFSMAVSINSRAVPPATTGAHVRSNAGN